MKKETVWNWVCGIVLGLQVLAEALAVAVFVQLNVLPTKYLVALCAVFVLLLALSAGLMFLHGTKKVSTARRIVAVVVSVVVIFGCLVVSKLALDASKTLHTMTNPDEPTDMHSMYLFVRQDDPAQTIADAAAYKFAILAGYDEERTQQAILMVNAQLGKTVDVTSYEKTADLADALLDGQADVLIINGAAIALLTEDENYADFTEVTRILLAIPLSQLEVSAPTEPSTEPAPVEKTVVNSPFVVYLSGSDTRNKKLRVSRSDVNILVVVNPVSKQILLLNTPRDYYVPNPAGNGKLDKLTHCGLYGTECSMQALGDLYGVQVDKYAQINFTGFETLVDAVGGITVYSDQSFTAGLSTQIKKGENQLNGEEALALVRDRYHVKGGDNGRGKNQMKVIAALINKMTSGTTIIANYSKILKSLEGMFKTSVTMDEISMLVKMQLEDMAKWNVQSYAVIGTGGSETTYSSPGHRAYVMWPNENAVAHASALIEKVMSGQVLTAQDMILPK